MSLDAMKQALEALNAGDNEVLPENYGQMVSDAILALRAAIEKPWQGLTEEEIQNATQAMDAEPLAEGWSELVKFARSIEAKLKEKNT